MPYKIKFTREVKIGVTTLAAILILYWGFNFLQSKDIFSKETHLFAVYPRIDGLAASNYVYINGLKVGYIKEVQFVDKAGGDILVEIVVRSKYKIPKNSVAHIFNDGLLGSRAMEIVIGNSLAYAENGDYISIDYENSFKDELITQLTPIKTKADKLLSNTDSLIASMHLIFNQQTQNNLIATFENIKHISQDLKGTASSLNGMLQSEDVRIKTILKNIENLSASLNQSSPKIERAIKNFASISDTLAKADIGRTLAQLEGSAAKMNTILSKIERGEGSAGLLLTNDSLYVNMKNMTENMNTLIMKISENPKKNLKISVF